MASDSSLSSHCDSSDDEQQHNNTHLEALLSDDGSNGSRRSGVGVTGPAAAATPGDQPPDALQQKKQECCDLFLATIKPGGLYESPKALQSSIVEIAKQYHFSVRRQGYAYICSRAQRTYTCKKKPSTTSAVPRKTFSLKVDCPFKICFVYADRKQQHQLTDADKQSKGKGLPRFSDRVRVTSICAQHGTECQLHTQELQTVLKKGGHLSRFESGQIVATINMVNNRAGRFAPNELREALQPFFPPDYALTSQDLVNFRIWAKKHVCLNTNITDYFLGTTPT